MLEPDSFAPVRVIPEPHRVGEGSAIRFRVSLYGIERDAFAVRYRGRLYAYVNSCGHQHQPLDFGDAHFFDDDYDALVCCHHGARYDPETGACRSGPCDGGALTALALEERDGALWCVGTRGVARDQGASHAP